VLEKLRPDIVVHGDDWQTGFQSNIRAEVIAILARQGGELREFPYSHSEADAVLKLQDRQSMPEVRRARLRRLLAVKPILSVMEAHNGLTGLIVEKTRVETPDSIREFDAIWVSSLCDSTARGKPDIELIEMSARTRTIEEIMEVTTKPIILDGDSGGSVEHFVFNIQTLERMGVSAVIIEDKTGAKRNSLFGDEAGQVQESIEAFIDKISKGKKQLRTRDFMIFARCESLILNQGIEDALTRCHAYTRAGADGIMIHSCRRDGQEIKEFCQKFRQTDPTTPIVAVPTTYHSITEAELAAWGVNICIYGNHLIRAAFPAMRTAAETILKAGRALEADSVCMPIKEILTLVPEK